MERYNLSAKVNNIQNIASDPRFNVLVAASAGTGKTKILTDRFIRLMLHGAPAEKILCLTFTNSAATEMKQRIMQKLDCWRVADELTITKELELLGEDITHAKIKMATDLHNNFHTVFKKLKIMTIHSLCAEIIKRFHGEHQSAFQILEPYEEKILRYNLLNEFFEELASNQTASCWQHYLFLSDYIDLTQIQNVMTQISMHCHHILSLDLHAITNIIYTLHKAVIDKTPTDIITQHLAGLDKLKWRNIHATLAQANESLAVPLKAWLDYPEEFGINKKFSLYINIFLTNQHSLRKKLVNKKFSDRSTELTEYIYQEQTRAEACLLKYKRQLCASLNHSIISLSIPFALKLKNAKSTANLLTFSDLIMQMLDMMQYSPKAPGILYSLDYDIDHVLVDESQDNSNEQWQVIKALTEEFFAGTGARPIERTIFLVGDIKQSIFSFQGASPEIFAGIGEFFADKVKSVNKVWQQLDMQTSFRSTQTVLDLVNKVFLSTPLHHSTESVEHTAYRLGKGVVEVWPLVERNALEKKEGWQLPQYEQIQDDKESVAIYIVEKIGIWIQSGRILPSTQRPIQAKDIMILVRKRSNIISSLKRNLHKKDIKVIEHSKCKLKEHIIAQDLISLLLFTIDQEDDLNLACLLKSPLFNIKEEELLELCHARSGSLWHQLKNTLPTIYQEANNFLESTHKNSLLQFLMHALYHQDKYSSFLQRFGEEAEVVINGFIDAAYQFETKISNNSYAKFIAWFQQADIEIQPSHNDKDAVRIMTVHAAKGLQAPIVILADAASTEHTPHQNVFLHENIPITSFYAEYDNELISLLKTRHKLQQSLESNRLLYVALTRAEDEIYIIGHANNRVKNSWYDIIASL